MFSLNRAKPGSVAPQHRQISDENLASDSPSHFRSRAVRFSSAARVRRTLTLSEYTDSEIAHSFYSKSDLDEVKKSVFKVVRRMRRSPDCFAFDASSWEEYGDFLDEHRDLDCVRGLEHMGSNRSVEDRALRKKRVYSAVLEEQDYQRAEGIRVELRLAEVSMVESRLARDKAAERGQSDASAAARFAEDCENECGLTKEEAKSKQDAELWTSFQPSWTAFSGWSAFWDVGDKPSETRHKISKSRSPPDIKNHKTMKDSVSDPYNQERAVRQVIYSASSRRLRLQTLARMNASSNILGVAKGA